MHTHHNAPGHPGLEPRWTGSNKSGVGTALLQNLWFTLSHGIVDEVYYPRIDQAAIRDLGLVAGDGRSWVAEEKRSSIHTVEFLAEGVPAYRLVNTCPAGRYRIEKEIIGDPHRPVLLQKIKFVPLQGKLADYRLYALLAPHLGNGGAHNTGWVGDHKGVELLFAERDNNALALGCTAPWLKRSAGFVGTSDGFTDLERHNQLMWDYQRAADGNVALTGEIDLVACNGEFLLVLAFGGTVGEAGSHARAGLANPFQYACDAYIQEWQHWQQTLLPLDRQRPSDRKNMYRVSTKVLRTHESTRFPGGMIASLSIPFGAAKGDADAGGYHVAWPRDLVMSAGGYLAAGAKADALRVLGFLEATQEADGHWKQCMWLDGEPYLHKTQLDEAALPILLVDLCRRDGALADMHRFWPMVKQALLFILLNGPCTQQDRWEEESGYTPFTIATEIAALLAGAEMAEANGEPTMAGLCRDTADAWHDGIDDWLYVRGNDWCAEHGVDGYYNRTTPNGAERLNGPVRPVFSLKNVPQDESYFRADHMVSVDALALVRFGLRAADDPRILNTVKVIDAKLKVETPNGAAWHRYNGDGYGEKADGTAFEQTGIGRVWPLLAGERGHYELLAGNTAGGETVRDAMETFANQGGMIPEQIWNSDDIPAHELYRGQPTGSGNPLVWAHAEYIKLLRSLRDGAVFDLPPQTVQRYQVEKITSPRRIWSFNHQTALLPPGKMLRLQVETPATIRWSADYWVTFTETSTTDTGLGIHIVDLPVSSAVEMIEFTFHWLRSGKWESCDYAIPIGLDH